MTEQTSAPARMTVSDHAMMFGAYFFGARRFSKNLGDGFNAADAEAYRSGGRKEFLKNNFKRATLVRVRQPRGGAAQVGQDAEQPTDVAEEVIELIEGTEQFTARFVIAQITICILLWCIFAISKRGRGTEGPLDITAGLDSLHEGTSDLRLSGEECQDHRFQVWRWITYQWTHVSISHLLCNMFVLGVLGAPLEGHEGFFRTALLFNAGVIGGALSYIVNDSHSYVVGCSGGIYALLGMHIADLALNWKEKQFRASTVLFLLFLLSVDLIVFLANAWNEMEISYSCNLGGLITGLLAGVLVGKNLSLSVSEVYLKRCCRFFGGLLILLCLVWLSENRAPRSIWEAMRGEAGYCWTGQFYNPEVNRARWSCFRCASKACIDGFMEREEHVLIANSKACRQIGWFFYEY